MTLPIGKFLTLTSVNRQHFIEYVSLEKIHCKITYLFPKYRVFYTHADEQSLQGLELQEFLSQPSPLSTHVQ